MDLVEASGKVITSRHPWEQARLSVIQKLIVKNLTLSKQSIVIDIGCGDTYVVENLAKKYPEVLFYAVDIAFTKELITKYTQSLTVKNVFLFQSLEEVTALKKGKSSLVILTDVIEHIEDDKKFISDLLMKDLFDEKTIFLITVPAYQNLFCSHDVFLGHYRRYTNTLLKENLTGSGMNVLSTGYFFLSLVPLRLLQCWKEKYSKLDASKISTGLVQWNKGNSVSSIFKLLLIVDANFSFLLKRIGVNLPGLSNYAICKKSV